jgi:hypothetical protein
MLWEGCVMTSKTADSTPPDSLTPQRRDSLVVNKVTAEDITASLKAGFADFLARPVMSGFFGLFYAVFGILIVWCLAWLGAIWMVIPAALGFPLIAPFAAAGLYEMSRRLQKDEGFGWSDILTVMANQRKREMGWMAFVTLFVFWVWMYQIRLWLALILQNSSFSDFEGFLSIVFYTPQGWTFLVVGTCVGAILVGGPVHGDRRRHADATRTGRRFRHCHAHLRPRRHGKPGGHAELGGDHFGDHAAVDGAGVSGPDLHPADPWPHHVASLPAGRATRGGMIRQVVPLEPRRTTRYPTSRVTSPLSGSASASMMEKWSSPAR